MAGRASKAVLAAASWLALAGSALATTPALVVDADTGRVLFAERATDPWFPASITKLMTTYVALDMVRQGKVSLSTPLTMSAAAIAQPPSKMGFKPGTQVTLDNALKIIMVKSANDVAYMIGENLGGSVEGFASLMNQAASRLGMRESRWFNPHGLPDERQQTSARDMAILARALLRDFPEHEGLFHIGALKLGSKIIRNHNGLLGRYPGADGMKTGFICAGGFNVVASATQNGRRLIAVVMGYGSARERDLRAADLFDANFRGSAGWGADRLENLPPSSSLSAPDMRPIVCSPNKRQPEADEEVAVVANAGATPENPISALFQASSFGNPGSAAGAPLLAARRTLGPRVAFEPVPIFIGPNQAEATDGRGGKLRIAARPVKTKVVGRTAEGPAVAAAETFAPGLKPTATARVVDTVKAAPKPAGKAPAGALAATRVADTQPRLGAVGGSAGGRPKLGAIPAKEIAAKEIAPAEPAADPKPAKPAVKATAAPPKKPAKPAGNQAAAGDQAAAAEPAAKPAARTAAKPKPAAATPTSEN